MRITLALAVAALCFSATGCACPRCPYLGYPIPQPRMVMTEEGEAFPDAPPAKPVKTDKKQPKDKSAKGSESITLRAGAQQKVAQGKSKSTPDKVATRAGLKPAVTKTPAPKDAASQVVQAKSKTEAATQTAAAKPEPKQLAAVQPKPTVRPSTIVATPAKFTPVAHPRQKPKPEMPANVGSPLAAVIVVSPPKAKGEAKTQAKPAIHEIAMAKTEPAPTPRLQQPGMNSGRGAKPAKPAAKPAIPLEASSSPASGAKQVGHSELGL